MEASKLTVNTKTFDPIPRAILTYLAKNPTKCHHFTQQQLTKEISNKNKLNRDDVTQSFIKLRRSGVIAVQKSGERYAKYGNWYVNWAMLGLKPEDLGATPTPAATTTPTATAAAPRSIPVEVDGQDVNININIRLCK